jgi:hypothetical protein
MADDPGRPPAGDLTGSRAARRASPPNLRAGRDRRAARSASGPGTWPGIRRTIQVPRKGNGLGALAALSGRMPPQRSGFVSEGI